MYDLRAPTVRFAVIVYLAYCLQRLGIPQDLLPIAPEPGPLPEPQTLVPEKLLWEVWESARSITGRTGWGVRVAELRPSPPGHWVATTLSVSATLVEALAALVQALPLVSTTVKATLAVDQSSTFFELRPDHPEFFHPERAELLLANVLQWLWPADRPPGVAVHLRHHPPADLRPQHRVLGKNLHYGSDRYGLALDTATALRTRAGSWVRESIAEAVEAAPSDIVSHVDRVIAEQLNGDGPATAPSIETAAARLGLHHKSLNRRLAAHGTSFRALLDAHRHGAALAMLGGPLPVHEIALRLGYSEPAAFVRAFRRWTGTSPGAYRQRTEQVSAVGNQLSANVIVR